jgi:hypothetical protein
MSRTTKQVVRWTWDQAAKTSSHDRKLQLAEVTRLVNCRRTQDGPAEKRHGYDKTVISTFEGGTYSGPATELIPSAALLVRDTSDQLWVKNATDGAAYFRGRHQRAFPTWYELQSDAATGRAHKPLAVIRNGRLWSFAVVAGGYQLTISDPVTETILVPTKTVVSADVASWAAVIDQSDNVWVFFTSQTAGIGGPGIAVHKWTSESATPAVDQVYHNVTSFQFTSIDAYVRPDGSIVVAGTSYVDDTDDLADVYISIVDPGTATVDDFITQSLIVGDSDITSGCSGAGILEMDGDNGPEIYVSFLCPSSTDGRVFNLYLANTTTALSSVTIDTLLEIGPLMEDSYERNVGVTSGYLDEDGNRVVYCSLVGYFGGAAEETPYDAQSFKVVWDGVAPVASIPFADAWLASKPIKLGDAWYVLTGFDDGADRAQRTYYLRDADGIVVTSILDGEGVGIFHAGALSDPDEGIIQTRSYSGHVVSPIVLGETIVLPLLSEGLTASSPQPVIAVVDFDAEYRSQAPGIVPGGIPVVVGPADAARELVPLLFPYRPIVVDDGGGSTSTTNRITYRWLTMDSDGDVTMSAPLETVAYAFRDGNGGVDTLSLPCNRHVFGKSYIAFYASLDGATDVFLQRVVENDPAQTYVDITVQPALFSADGESLDVVPGVRPPTSVPPVRLSLVWRDRTWLGPDPQGRVWHSDIHEDGRGPKFNPVFTVRWTTGTGALRAWCPQSADAFAWFKEDAIGLVQGPGPDGAGAGQYQVYDVPGKHGCSNPAAVVQGPLGVYFKRHEDGRFCVLSGASVTEIGQGAEQWIAETVTASEHLPDQGCIKFYFASGKVAALDYRHPLPDQPAGQWYEESSDGLPAAVGVTADGTALSVGDTDEVHTFKQGVAWEDDGEPVLVAFETGRLAPAGILGEFDVMTVQLSSEHRGGDSTFTYTLIDDQGTEEAHPDVATDEADVAFTSGINRTREVRLRIEETSATGEGRVFDGVAMEAGVYSRTQHPRRRIG